MGVFMALGNTEPSKCQGRRSNLFYFAVYMIIDPIPLSWEVMPQGCGIKFLHWGFRRASRRVRRLGDQGLRVRRLGDSA